MTKRYRKYIVTPDGLEDVGTCFMDDVKADEANRQPATNGYAVVYELVNKAGELHGDNVRHEG